MDLGNRGLGFGGGRGGGDVHATGSATFSIIKTAAASDGLTAPHLSSSTMSSAEPRELSLRLVLHLNSLTKTHSIVYPESS